MDKLKKLVRKIALVMSAIFMSSFFSNAQTWLELMPGAERLSFDERSGIERLTGILSFKYQNNIMYCDSAHYKKSSMEVWTYGRVQLNAQDSLNLYCDSMYYNGKTKKAKMWGHVRVRDREYKLTSDSVDYDAKTDQVSYKYGGKLENITTAETLTSRVGYFHPNTQESFFRGNVVYKSPDLKMTTDTLRYNYLQHRVYFYGPTKVVNKETTIYCGKGWYNVESDEAVLQKEARIIQNSKIIVGDSLYYAPLKKIGIAKGNVVIYDSIQKVQLTGGYVYSDELKGVDLVSENALVCLEQKLDTLYLTSDTLFHFRDSLNKTISIKGNCDVGMFQKKFQARADSMDYQRESGIFDLWGNPHFWAENSELNADSLRIFTKNDSVLDKVLLHSHAIAVSEIDSGAYFNQLAGREIIAFFTNNELIRAEVNSNAQTLFFPIQEEKKDSLLIRKRLGMNSLNASDIRVSLDSGEVVGIRFINKPTGRFVPMDLLEKTDEKLPNFTWNPFLRPKKWQDLLN